MGYILVQWEETDIETLDRPVEDRKTEKCKLETEMISTVWS